ncbi:MAG: 2-amino-4-hydroxy-6-hydroxymethyldihydropteridine diphosphokinase [Nitrospirae bacterium]|nr:2-amino-4-hydroxy-6-hydroxymethyldihydropteridine diphosphokinase [Nitrospirota bacterium]
MQKKAYLGIGSNIGNKIENCKKAIELLNEHTQVKVLKISGFYETEPVGYKEQEWFVNCAVEIKTDLNPQELLLLCQTIESKLGRERKIKYGPRIIDLDILLYNNDIIDNKDLKTPHPEMQKRGFVLKPLSDIAPDAVHPVLKRKIADLMVDITEKSIVKKIN